MALPRGEALAVEKLMVTADHGDALPMTEVWDRTGVDAMLVMHRGKVVFEAYFGDMSAARQHPMFSCTKSIVGLLVEDLIHSAVIDPSAPASVYLPELAASPVGSASIRQLLDMQAHFMFSDKPKADGQVQVDYIMGLGFLPRPSTYSGANGAYELLENARPMGSHGGRSVMTTGAPTPWAGFCDASPTQAWMYSSAKKFGPSWVPNKMQACWWMLLALNGLALVWRAVCAILLGLVKCCEILAVLTVGSYFLQMC